MLTANYKLIRFRFKKPAGTSRGELREKVSYFIFLRDTEQPGLNGTGECSIIPGLSPDDRPDLEKRIHDVCREVERLSAEPHSDLSDWPAVQTAINMAFTDLKNGGKGVYFPSSFTEGKTVLRNHGLIWMSPPGEMLKQIEQKLLSGHHTIKMKIGAWPMSEELAVIKTIRREFRPEEVSIRLDANGAYSPREALNMLNRLAEYEIHSVEQPIQKGQHEAMAALCADSPVAIALDEELIGVTFPDSRRNLLSLIKPAFLVLKPSLLGGFSAANDWVEAVGAAGIPWWTNSALESAIGLNALAQWTASTGNSQVQGLGTGDLFTFNIPSPVETIHGVVRYNPEKTLDLTSLI